MTSRGIAAGGPGLGAAIVVVAWIFPPARNFLISFLAIAIVVSGLLGLLARRRRRGA